MNKDEASFYCCPKCKSHLTLKIKSAKDNLVIEGELSDDAGHSYPIIKGIPHFFDPIWFKKSEKEVIKSYNTNALSYDYGIEFFFKTLKVDETKLRKQITGMLEFSSTGKVLEIACGTGKDSEFLDRRINEGGKLYLQDASLPMIELCHSKLSKTKNRVEFALTHSEYLPFDDKVFDAVFHFGGINEFANINKTIEEMTRITKIGGKVVIGDESLSPWLRDTLFGKLLTNSNPLFKHNVPLEHLPNNAKEVQINWIAEGTFYVIKYTVGKDLPYLDTDTEFPGYRGGTYRTRYYGKLEGVTEETKELASRANKKSGKSFHKWLDSIISDAAKKELGLNSEN